MTSKENRSCRIVLGATCFADAKSAINIAVDLAEMMNGQIDALLIEEEAISRFAALPFARTISYSGYSKNEISPEIMRQAFKHDADVFERALAEAAEKAMLDWSFDKRGGEITSLTEQDLISGDFVLFGFLKFNRRRSEKILILDNDDIPADQLLKAGIDIADKMDAAIDKITLSKGGEKEAIEYIQSGNWAAVVTLNDTAKLIGLSDLINASRSPLIVSI